MNEKLINELESKLQQKEKELYSIQKIGQALSSTLHLDELLNLIMKEITILSNADRSTLYLVDREKGEIWSKIALKAEIKEIRQKLGVGISGYVAATGDKINIRDAYRDQRFDPTTDKKTGYQTKSILCLPVWEPTSDQQSREVMGVIQVLNKKDGFFTDEDEAIMEAVASEVAVALSNARLYEELEKKYREIDLLYEFEQKLSGTYKLDDVLSDILSDMLNYLNCGETILVYPDKSILRLVSAQKKNGFDQNFHLPAENLDLSFLMNPVKDDNKLRPEFNRMLKKDFNFIRKVFLSVDDEGDPLQVFLFLQDVPSLKSGNEEHSRILDIILQKICRAIELHYLREKILKQERLSAVGQMMSTIVHDLRSPIGSINGFLELLLETDTTPEEREEFADIMRFEIQSITNMTTEILDFAKGKTSILPRKTSAIDILKRFQPQLEQLFRDSGIVLKINNHSQNLIYADTDKLIRVFYNIAKNAKEALGSKGNFVFTVNDQDSVVVFNLEDDGPGIPEEIKNHIFESFVTSGKASGTGLGLAIVKKIIDEHQGTIELKSAPGHGTSFCIKLPQYKIEE
ncbi:MAG: GAF domain-containing sensor histidine kinase [Calditrichaeota bacterium]|nr:GAF domain-containing sensor histidine kinase [Calditrichota bacterium]